MRAPRTCVGLSPKLPTLATARLCWGLLALLCSIAGACGAAQDPASPNGEAEPAGVYAEEVGPGTDRPAGTEGGEPITTDDAEPAPPGTEVDAPSGPDAAKGLLNPEGEPPTAADLVAAVRPAGSEVAAYEPEAATPLTPAEWDEAVAREPYPREGMPEPPEPFRPLDPGFAEGLGTLAWVLVVGLLVGLLGYLLYARSKRPDLSPSRRDYGEADELLSASADELATGLAANLDGGDYREAIRMRFGQVLQTLRERGLLVWVPGRTNAEYAAALPERLRDGFGALSADFSFATYAGRDVTEARYRGFAAAADAFLAGAVRDTGMDSSGIANRGGSPPAAASVALALAALLITGCGSEWDRNLDPAEDGPHGTDLLEGLLRVRYPGATFRTLAAGFGESPTWGSVDALPAEAGAGDVYVAIGPALAYDSLEVEALSDFVADGGRALLASRELSIELSRAIYRDSCLGDRFRLYGPMMLEVGDTLRTNRGEAYAFTPVTEYYDVGEWESVTKLLAYGDCAVGLDVLVEVARGEVADAETKASAADESSQAADAFESGDGIFTDGTAADDKAYLDSLLEHADVGYHHDREFGRKPVMVAVPHGEGHFLVLGAPILLANAYLADTSNRAAVEALLSYLGPEVTSVTYDAPRRSPVWAVARDNAPEGEGFGPDGQREPLLREVFKRPALAAAWYLLLAGVVTFVLFGTKRLQRIVPVVQPTRNTTLAYLGNVSRLYLARPNNRLMATKQLALFEAFCVRKFGLRPVRDAADRERLAGLKGVDPVLVESLARYQQTIANEKAIGNDAFLRLVHILRTLYGQLGRRSAAAQ